MTCTADWCLVKLIQYACNHHEITFTIGKGNFHYLSGFTKSSFVFLGWWIIWPKKPASKVVMTFSFSVLITQLCDVHSNNENTSCIFLEIFICCFHIIYEWYKNLYNVCWWFVITYHTCGWFTFNSFSVNSFPDNWLYTIVRVTLVVFNEITLLVPYL